VFGRPQRISACECERVSEANLAQALHLLNSDEIQGKLSRPGGRADLMAKDKRSDAEKIDELFAWALARKPTDEQRQIALEMIEKSVGEDKTKGNEAAIVAKKKLAYEDVIWALLNTKEFVFNK